MAQQNLNIGLSREQIRAAVQADFVELYAALNSAYGTNLVPRLLNSGLSDSQVLDFTRANFADLYAALKAQGAHRSSALSKCRALKRSVARRDAGELH